MVQCIMLGHNTDNEALLKIYKIQIPEIFILPRQNSVIIYLPACCSKPACIYLCPEEVINT